MLSKAYRLTHDYLVLLIVTMFGINPYDFIEKRRKNRSEKAVGTSNTALRGTDKEAPSQVDFPCSYQLGDKETEVHFYNEGDSRAG